MRLTLPLLFLTFYCSTTLLSQKPVETTPLGSTLLVKLGNDMNLVLMPITSTGSVEMTFYLKTGSVFETDSLHGIANLIQTILSAKITAYLANTKNQVNAQNTVFSGSTNTEQSIFKFTTGNGSIATCMALMRDSVFDAKFTQFELANARNTVLQAIEDARHDARKIFQQKMLDNLYTQDHARLQPTGDINDLRGINLKAIKAFYQKYYVPNNALGTITGNFNQTTVQADIQANFNALIKSEFDPESVTKFHGLRPMAYTTQFIVEDTASNPEFQICWQFPGASTNQISSYRAYLLATMLSDPNNYLQVKARKLGCKKFAVNYELNNFNGIFKITIQPSKANLIATYRFIVDEMGNLSKTLINQTMVDVAKLQFKTGFQHLKQSKEYPADVVKYWVYNDESYFITLPDSVAMLTENDMQDFVVDYFKQSPHTTGLLINRADRASLKIDSAFTDLDESVGRYVFKYRLNITDLEGNDNSVMLNNLLQWLTINNDVTLQVNGFSDEHEFNRATDDSVLRFIDSLPNFQRTMPDVIKKGYLRPEMMRALKIVKYLYQHGIPAERLFGTSMMFTSGNKQQAADNMKCTLTLNKYHKGPSLYEFHYGRKQE